MVALAVAALAAAVVLGVAQYLHVSPGKPPVAKPVRRDLPSDPVTIAAVGDVLLGGKVGTQAEKVGRRNLLVNVREILAGTDLAFCNLECPLSARGTPTPLKTAEDVEAKREFLFRGLPEAVKSLTLAGIDIVSLANNHIMDYGGQALDDTISALDSAHIGHSGAGEDARSARMPAILKAGKCRVAFLSYAWSGTLPGTWSFEAGRPAAGCAFLRTNSDGKLSRESARMLCRDMEVARCLADLVIVSLHWGIEKEHRPLPQQRALARTVIDFGADAVLGHHPHVVQGIEVYRGRPIAYSLGNFVFPSRRDPNNDTCILLLTLGGTEPYLEVVPVQIEYGIPYVAVGEESVRIARFVAALSAELGTASIISEDGSLVIRLSPPTSQPEEP